MRVWIVMPIVDVADPMDLDTVIRGEFGCTPASWNGQYHLHVSGKTGETFFVRGLYADFVARFPAASLFVHVHPHYGRVAEADGVTVVTNDPWWSLPDMKPYGLADQAALGTRMSQRFIGQHAAYRREGNELHTMVYRTHTAQPLVPWYQMFARAAGLKFVRPTWSKPTQSLDKWAILFVTGNKHTGGLRSFDFADSWWLELSGLCLDRGLIPATVGHPEDGDSVRPGFSSLETDDPAEVLSLLVAARSVVGLNSGIVWAATQIAPGKVTMIDTQGRPEYAFKNCVADGVIDPERHFQVPERIALAQGMFETLGDALR